MSSSKSSKVLVCFRKGKLALGVLTNFLTTLASHDVTLFSLSSASSSRLKFLKEGGVRIQLEACSLCLNSSSLAHQRTWVYIHVLSGWGMAQSQKLHYCHFSGESIPLEAFGEPVSHL